MAKYHIRAFRACNKTVDVGVERQLNIPPNAIEVLPRRRYDLPEAKAVGPRLVDFEDLSVGVTAPRYKDRL